MDFKNSNKRNTFNPNSWRRKVNLGMYMKGSIRAHNNAHCVKCGKKQFKQINVELIDQKVPQCSSCGGGPNRYILRKIIPGVNGKGKTKDFYTDHAGNILKDVKECIGLLYKINSELESGGYEPEDYDAGFREDLKFKVIASEYIKHLDTRSRLSSNHDNSITPSSLRNSKCHLRNLLPFFGDIDVRKINKRLILSYFNSWEDRLRTRDLSTSELRTILRWAKRDLEVLKELPEFPKIRRARELRQDEIPTIEEQMKIILNIKNEVYKTAYILGAILAKRPSEIRAWKVEDVDLIKKTIQTKAHFSKGGKGIGEVLISGRKSVKESHDLGIITDPLDDYLCEILNPYVENKDPMDFLFINIKGNFLKQSCFREYWVKSAKELGLGKFKSYAGLKHCTLSNLIEITGDFGLTKNFSGHTNIKTLERYAKNKGNKKSEIIGQSTSKFVKAAHLKELQDNEAKPGLKLVENGI